MQKVCIVTGASSGIGLELSRMLLDEGYKVIMSSRSIENNIDLSSTLSGDFILKNLDVSSKTSVVDFFIFVKNNYHTFDALVNCAGYVEPESLFSTTLENWERTISINLTGVFLCCKYGGLLMREVGGRIINVASTAGLSPRPGWSAYAASKSGVISFTNAISEELKDYGIKMFIVCPGRTATPLRKILAPNEDPTTIMQPQSVAEIISLCISGKLDVMEGQPLLVRERF